MATGPRKLFPPNGLRVAGFGFWIKKVQWELFKMDLRQFRMQIAEPSLRGFNTDTVVIPPEPLAGSRVGGVFQTLFNLPNRRLWGVEKITCNQKMTA